MALNKKQTLLSLVMLAGAIALTSLMYLNRPDTGMSEPTYVPVSVDVVEAVRESISIPVQAQGTVTPLQESVLMAEVKGRIVEVSPNFNVGGFVARDEVLLRLDPRDYQTNLLRAKAALRSAESNLAQEKGRADVALREWRQLPAGSQRSAEAKDLYLRKPQLDLAQAQLLSAQADLNTAQDDLDRTVISAPYAALIRAKNGDLGQFVTAGTSLAEIFSVDQAEVRLPIPQTKLAYLDMPGLHGYDEGTLIDLYTDVSGVVTHWSARLHRSEGVFDERSRALYTVARIDDPYGIRDPGQTPLRIGTFVNANIAGKQLPDLVALPRHVLRAGDQVWVLDEKLQLRNRKVTSLRIGGDLLYISSGLDNGDLVVITSLDNSLAGAEVKVQSRVLSSELRRATLPPQESGPRSDSDTSVANAGSNARGTDG